MTATYYGAASMTARIREAAADTLSFARNLSHAAREVARLEREGYLAGEPREIDFSLCFPDPAEVDAALADVRRHGFVPEDTGRAAQGFVTVRSSVRLRAYDLSRLSARLERLADRHGGYAELVGPADRAERAVDERDWWGEENAPAR